MSFYVEESAVPSNWSSSSLVVPSTTWKMKEAARVTRGVTGNNNNNKHEQQQCEKDKCCPLDKLRSETQQLIEKSEQLVHYVTHLCYQKYTSVFRPRFTFEDGLPSRCCSRNEDAANCRCKGFPCHWDVTDEILSSNVSCSKSNSPERKVWQDEATRSGAGPPKSAATTSPTTTTSCTLRKQRNRFQPLSLLTLFILLVAGFARVSECCSSRSTPKPRLSSPTHRPNVTFQTYACPPAYAAWYCLNGATCFTVKIQNAILYNCECAEGYMGPRCEFKDLDGSYLPAKDRVLLETASIAGGACMAIILVFMVLFTTYVFVHKDRGKRSFYCSPYNDKKPLGDPGSQASEFVCTIPPAIMPVPVHRPNSEKVKRSEGEDSGGLFYVVSGRNGADWNACTCQRRDLAGHVICLKHSKRFLLPTNVPSFV